MKNQPVPVLHDSPAPDGQPRVQLGQTPGSPERLCAILAAIIIEALDPMTLDSAQSQQQKAA